MREDLIERLDKRLNKERAVHAMEHNAADRERAELIRLLSEAAAALEAAREDGADAERYRWLKAHDNAYLLAEDVIDDQIAIDQARGKAGGEVEGG